MGSVQVENTHTNLVPRLSLFCFPCPSREAEDKRIESLEMRIYLPIMTSFVTSFIL